MSYTDGGMGRVNTTMRVLMRHPGLGLETVRFVFVGAFRRGRARPRDSLQPDQRYLHWTVATPDGSPLVDLVGANLIGYLRWRRWQRAAT